MKAVVVTQPGGPEVLQLQDVPDPTIHPDEVLIKVRACALNRADILQRQGSYPPPPGASEYLGLECSGVIETVGEAVTKWKVGEEVCALVEGGGYAEKVAVPEGCVFPIPKGVSLIDAAALPESSCTVWSSVFMTSKLTSGEVFLVHGGTSGIGTFAIQIAKANGVKVFTTVGSADKAKAAMDLGADLTINYKNEDFVTKVKEATGGKGVDVILDNMGGPYLTRNVEALGPEGRLYNIGWMGGSEGQINLAPFIKKRLTLQGGGLRSRDKENKARIVAEVVKNVWPKFEAKTVRPITYKTFPLAEASKAHSLMESSGHVGKIILIA